MFVGKEASFTNEMCYKIGVTANINVAAGLAAGYAFK